MKKRIESLEKKILELEARIRALERRTLEPAIGIPISQTVFIPKVVA